VNRQTTLRRGKAARRGPWPETALLAEVSATLMPREAEVPQATAGRIRPPEGLLPYAEAALDRACRRIVGVPNGEQGTTINAEALSISTPSDLSEGQS
jgi:hypothetical protein